MKQSRPRILTGDRPTGHLHLGHYVGSIANRVQLQREYECFFIVADLHSLTTRSSQDDIAGLNENIRQMILDYLACGIDPERSIIYLQSAVPETCELSLLLGMLVTVPRLQRIPSLKIMKDDAHLKEMPLGLLGYPVLQSADILIPRAHLVPIGRDNEAHVELTRELVRRFNSLYGEVFPVPRALIGDVPSLIGTDGNAKMSKSLNNAILLSDEPETIKRKVMRTYTDPQRIRADIPGRVEGNPVFDYHDAFNPNRPEVAEMKERYQHGRIGDVEVKMKLVQALNNFLNPIRERRASFEARSGYVEEILYRGTLQARREAQATMLAARQAMGLSGIWNRIVHRVQQTEATAEQ